MWDENQEQLKALLWTKFIHINMQTGKRDNHPQWFMELASGFENVQLQQAQSINERIAMLVKKLV
jgi:acyl-CoA thioester hydrolase